MSNVYFNNGGNMFKSKDEALEESRGIMKMITREPSFSDGSKIMRLQRRFVMVSTEYFPLGLMRDLIEFAGEEAAVIILYQGGFNSGKAIFDRYYGIVKDRDKALHMCASSAWYFGWGIATIYTENKNGEIIGHARIYDSFEAEEYIRMNKSSPGKKCHFFRGVLAGIMSEYAGKEYMGEEIKCMADGDEYCEFVIKPK